MLRREQGGDPLDVMMPTINGDKLARMFRHHPQREYLGIVLVSSRSEKELSSLALSAQADEVVSKGTSVAAGWTPSCVQPKRRATRRGSGGSALAGLDVPSVEPWG
jgi:PleD family two-component response regulator